MRRNIQALGGKDKCVRRRFRGGHIVSGYHRDRCRDLEVPKQLINVRAFAAGGQGPGRADLVKILQQLFRAGLDANLRNHLAEDAGAYLFYGLNFRFVDLLAEFTEKCGKEEAPAHADAAVNFPVRQANFDVFERYLLYLTGRRECAEDLAQETWIRVLQRGSQYNGRQRFDPWLFAIARNLAIDYLRKKRKAVATVSLPNDRDAMLLLPSSDPSPFEAAARSEDAMRLAGRLQILPPLYREALLLRFQEDLSLAEMAQVLGAPTTTVTSRIYRGLAALRSAFEEGDSHGG